MVEADEVDVDGGEDNEGDDEDDDETEGGGGDDDDDEYNEEEEYSKEGVRNGGEDGRHVVDGSLCAPLLSVDIACPPATAPLDDDNFSGTDRAPSFVETMC